MRKNTKVIKLTRSFCPLPRFLNPWLTFVSVLDCSLLLQEISVEVALEQVLPDNPPCLRPTPTPHIQRIYKCYFATWIIQSDAKKITKCTLLQNVMGYSTR